MRKQTEKIGGGGVTSQPSVVDSILAFIAERRDALSELEAAIMKTQHLFAQPIGVALAPAPIPAPPALPPASVARRARTVRPATTAPRATTTVRQVSGRRPRYSVEEIQTRILDALGKQKVGIQISRLVSLVGLSQPTVQPVLVALIATGAVVRHGVNAHTRIGLPAVMTDAVPAAAATPMVKRPAAVKGSDTADALIEALEAKIASGASYAPAEILRALRLVDASVTIERATELLEQFAREGAVERIPIAEGVVRYRKRAKTKARA